MDVSLKHKYIRRISYRKVYGIVSYLYNNYNVIYNDPSQDILVEADFKYDIYYKDIVSQGVMTQQMSYDRLINDGLWSKEKDEEIIKLFKNLETMKQDLLSAEFDKTKQRFIQENISRVKAKILELHKIKNQLNNSTAEHLSEIYKKRWIISKISTVENTNLLNIPPFLDVLAVYYYEDTYLSDAEIRELARSDPWRLYWTVSKDTSTPIFNVATSEFTELQYSLVLWSRVYDFAFNCEDRPSDDVINNDDKFDSWYTNKINNSNNYKDTSRFGKGGEVFIPADQEGAKEVYKLNDTNAMSKIKERQNALSEKGSLHEVELPDVKRQLKMEFNKMSMNRR